MFPIIYGQVTRKLWNMLTFPLLPASLHAGFRSAHHTPFSQKKANFLG